MSMQKQWLGTLLVAGVIGLSVGALRIGRLQGRASGGQPQAGCGGPAVVEQVGSVEQAVGPSGTNNVAPYAVDSDPLKRGTTNAFNLTSPSNSDVRALCQSGTVTATGCTLATEWNSWRAADSTNRDWIMKGIAKCAVDSSFTIRTADGSKSFSGQWPLYPSWKSSPLSGTDKHERISACILALLNGNNQSLTLCIIGPGGSPFSDGCADPTTTVREGGFFGNLFLASPVAYVAGPDSDEIANTGRVCTSNNNSYCCAEADAACTHRVVLAGAILGSAAQSYANRRCNQPLVTVGGRAYCPSFFSTREPSYSYTNVFTSFVPPL